MNRNMKAITWAMEVRGLEPGPWRVLMVLCGHVNKQNYEVWPSFSTIAEKAEISRDSAKRYIGLLTTKGFIEFVGEMWRPNGGRSSNKYRICVDEIAVPAEDHEEEDSYVAQDDPRGNLHRGQGQGSAPGARGTAAPSKEPLLEGTSQLEDSPLPTEGTPFVSGEGDLFGTDIVPSREDIVHYVERHWHELKNRHPGIAGVRKIDDGLAHTIRLRTKQHMIDGEDEFEMWSRVFAEVDQSPFLQGRAAPRAGSDVPFKLSLGWLLGASKFREVINGKYSNRSTSRFAYDREGNRLTQSEQGARESVEGVLGRRQRRRSGLD